MMMSNIPGMLVSETQGWDEIDRSHYPARWFFKSLVLPMSLLPPALYAYAELAHPGAIFPLTVPGPTPVQLVVAGVILFGVQLLMVTYMAMLIQRTAQAHDHDPGYDGAYALAAIAPVPLWLSSLSLLVPSQGFVIAVGVAAWIAALALIRHGVRPLLHVGDEVTAHRIANRVSLAGISAGIGLMIVSALVLSMMLVSW